MLCILSNNYKLICQMYKAFNTKKGKIEKTLLKSKEVFILLYNFFLALV